MLPHAIWRADLAARLVAGSSVAETTRGHVEYALRGTGPVLLVSHGTPGGYDFGLLFAELFRDLPLTFLCVSRPGYLRTPLEAGVSPEEQADAFAALLDALGTDHVVMAGISGGGPAALQFALRHPRRYRALLLVSAITKAQPAQERSPGFRFLHHVIFSSDVCGWAMAATSRLLPDWAFRVCGVPPAMRRMSGTLFPVALRRPGHRNDGQQFASLPAYPLEQIRCPALVLHGTADGVVPFANGEFAAAAIPGAEFLPIAGAGHSLLALRWREVAPRIRDFLRAHAE